MKSTGRDDEAAGRQPNSPISQHFRVKKTQLQGLKRLGIETAHDLLYHFPSRYVAAAEDFSGTLTAGENIALTGTIEKIGMRRTRGKRRMMIAEAAVRTGEQRVRVVWFHQPYIAKQYAVGDVVTLSGNVSGGKTLYLTNPVIKRASGSAQDESVVLFDGDNEGGSGSGAAAAQTTQTDQQKTLTAIYPETHGISSLFISARINDLLSEETIKHIEDPLPEEIRTRLNLPTLYEALLFIHRPRSEHEHTAARKRFMFEKTMLLQVVQYIAKNERLESQAYNLSIDTKQTDTFMNDRFEFTPTTDQKKAVNDILNDIKKNKPMARLLEGDVGSGKTAVAAAVMHGVVSAIAQEKTSGRPQCAYLAPTEVLAKQQFETLVRLFNHLPIQLGFIGGKECLKYPSKVDPTQPTSVSKAQLKKWMVSGELAIVVGTHAVIQKDIQFKRLALVIIDEQHRFGVAQRQRLINSADTYTPHLLSMTATPIPRTLALTVYGDLDISVIQQVPKGRKAVKTSLLSSNSIQTAYDHIRKEVESGHQAYVLCPRVREEESSPLRSVEEEYNHLSKTVFPDLAIAVLHGKMKPREKQEVMEKFSSGETNVLVCTTVVEVGMNIPNATIITILHAERFGLSQLHQLRGRVIRSSHQPYCYAITDSKNEQTLERLKTFETIHNGFTLSEKDLDMRGSGELAGLRQSGVPDLVMEGLRNPKLLEIAQQEAARIAETDPTLTHHPTLKNAIQQQTTIHGE